MNFSGPGIRKLLLKGFGALPSAKKQAVYTAKTVPEYDPTTGATSSSTPYPVEVYKSDTIRTSKGRHLLRGTTEGATAAFLMLLSDDFDPDLEDKIVLAGDPYEYRVLGIMEDGGFGILVQLYVG